jgi:membrane protease YdiL (CAAX protease family)
MPPQLTPEQAAVALVMLGAVATMGVAWVWALARLAMGRGLLPPAPIRVVPWRGKHVVGMLLLYIGVQFAVPLALLSLGGMKPGKGKLGPETQMLLMTAVNGVFLAVGPLLLASWSGAGPSDFGLERGRVGWDVVRGVVAWPLLAPIVFGVNLLALYVWKDRMKHPLEQWAAGGLSTSGWLLAGLSAVVLAPLVEEFLFRGVLLGWLGRWASGMPRAKPSLTTDPDFGFPAEPEPEPREIWFEEEPAAGPAPTDGQGWRFLAANVVVSLVFAALHGPVWPSPVPLFFLSLGLGVLYQRTGGLVAPVALHATFNALSTLLLYLTIRAGGPDALKPAVPEPVPPVAPKAAGEPGDDEAARPRRPPRIIT